MIVLIAVMLLTAATLCTAAVLIATLPMPYSHSAPRDKWYIFTSSTISGIAFHINIKYHSKKQLFKAGIRAVLLLIPAVLFTAAIQHPSSLHQ